MTKSLPVLLGLCLPASLEACAVCFGRQGSQNLIKAYTWGLFLMLGFTFFLMSALALTIYRIETHYNE